MSTSLRLAFLGDIHGNLPALEAALADLRQQAPDAVYLLGDLVNRCPWNNEVMALLREQPWPSIQGNHDLVIGDLHTPASREPFTNRGRFPVIYWTWAHLESEYIQYLRQLPEELVIAFEGAPAIRLFHGVPGNPFEGIYPETDDATIEETFTPFPEPVIICGHTHRPLERGVNGKVIFNGGSIGLPYNSDPRAQYMLLDLVNRQNGPTWQPVFRQVEYDRSSVPTAFEASGMMAEAGPVSELYMRTVLNGEPWASDFGHWLKQQPAVLRSDLQAAVERYLDQHGPHNWAFFQ